MSFVHAYLSIQKHITTSINKQSFFSMVCKVYLKYVIALINSIYEKITAEPAKNKINA